MSANAFDFPEFIQQVNEHHRRISWWANLLLLLGVISLLCFVGWMALFELPPKHLGEVSGWGLIVLGCWFVVSTAAFIALCRHLPKQPQQCCPACRYLLGHAAMARFVIATGCCPKCYHPLVDEPESDPPETTSNQKLITREEFQRQRKTLRFPLPRGPLIIGLIAIGSLTGWLQHWKHEIDETTVLACFIAVILIGGAGLIGYIVLWSRRRSRELSKCSCPECNRAIAEGSLPLMTGNCSTCGAQVFADPPPRPIRKVGESAMALHEVKSCRQWWQCWGWICCILGSTPAPLIVALIFPWDRLDQPPTPLNLLWVVAMIAIQIAGIGLAVWGVRILKGLKCPNCRQDLTDYLSLVIASRNCPCCATKVVAG